MKKSEEGNGKELYYLYGKLESFQENFDREVRQIHETLGRISNKLEDIPTLHGRIAMMDRELKETKLILSTEDRDALLFAKKIRNTVDKMTIPLVVGAIVLVVLGYSVIQTVVKWKPILETFFKQ